jgi:hypothetical protein
MILYLVLNSITCCYMNYIYAVGHKCTWTASTCPVCFTSRFHLAAAPVGITKYQLDINELLECIKSICERTFPSACNNSAKYHLPYHWLDTRLQLGRSAAEKSQERKLGEAQKKYFPFTNGKHDGTQVHHLHYICAYEMYNGNAP